MGIQAQIDRIKANVASAFAMIAEKGGTVSGVKSADLASAIGTIPTMSGFYAFYIDASGHLILEYDTIEQPPFSIDESGHLIYTGLLAPLSINSEGHVVYTIGG